MTIATVSEQIQEPQSPAPKVPAVTTPAPTATAQRSNRKYFEVFGDALTENLFLRNAVVLLGGLCLILSVGLVRLGLRAPVVIRVDNLGDPVAFLNTPTQNAVTAPEVRNFAEHFTRYLLGWDAYTLVRDARTALAMATPAEAQRLLRILDSMGAETITKEHDLRTDIQITQINVDRDTPEMVRVRVRGTRTQLSYSDKTFKKETTFEDTFVAKKVARSLKTPWGLLVDDWQESIFQVTP